VQNCLYQLKFDKEIYLAVRVVTGSSGGLCKVGPVLSR